ncbi:MAG: S8 family serine peptidase [Thermoplasmatota archaeon]
MNTKDRSSLIALVLVIAFCIQSIQIIPDAGGSPVLPGTNEWWNVETMFSPPGTLGVLGVGAFFFDPLEDGDHIKKIPGSTSFDPLLVQARDPSAMAALKEHEGREFRQLDIISSDTIVVLPMKDGAPVIDLLGPLTRAMIEYHPILKIDAGLFDSVRAMDGRGEFEVVVGLYTTPDDLVLEILDRSSLHGIEVRGVDGTIRGMFSTEDIIDIAAISSVSHVSLDGFEGVDNDIAADIIDVLEVWNGLALNGSGQIVAVADTGLDSGSNSTLHQDFKGRVTRTYTYGRAGNWSDADIHVWDPATSSWEYEGGHGTHVVGSVLGDGTASSGAYRGMAPDADLVMQSTMTSTGSLSIPAYNTLFSDAYRSGARIQTNSWSTRSSYGNYTWRSWQTDNYIWNNKDMLVLFSAGNQGSRGAYSVSTQASAKNVIAVGASESYRPSVSSSANNISELASFSSLGPTWGDNRIKPDVVAPGTWILSTRSKVIPDFWTHYWGTNSTYQGVNRNYAYLGGTSMSTPIVAGMTALIRQYYEDVEGHTPSAALLKATVINGARPLDGDWSSVPNNSEGWGRVNLSNSLATEDGDSGRLKFIDNTTGLTAGQNHTRLFTVANSNRDLVITLVWSDYPGSNTSSTKLVNDLDLKVISPNGTVYNGNDPIRPFNSSKDSSNNVERVLITDPPVGMYTLWIDGYSVTAGPQPYAIAMTGNLSDAVGWMEWDKGVIPANGTSAHLLLADSNLTGTGWVNVKVNTSSDPEGEIMNLTEVVNGGKGIGIFKGSVRVVTGTPSSGEVSVSTDEDVTAYYQDAYPKRMATATTRALIPPKVVNVTHDTGGRTLTYMDKVTVTVRGTPGWDSWFDVTDLNGRKGLPALDDGVFPDIAAADGNYTGSFTVPNLVKGNYTIKGYISRPFLDPSAGLSSEPVRIDTNIPRRPNNLSVKVIPSGNALRLDWDNPGDVNLMSYKIYRTTETSPGSGLPGPYSLVHNTPDNRTFFVDTGLADGILYFFRVSSFNILGLTSEPTEASTGIPEDTVAPWLDLNGPPHATVISREVVLNYTSEEDAIFVEFQIAADRDNNMIPDTPWSVLINDTTPSDPLLWDTASRPVQINEGDWFILRARVLDEVDNENITVPLARYSIDNTPPGSLTITSETGKAQNISVYHLEGTTEAGSKVVVMKDGFEVRSVTSGGNGRFEAFIELELGVNEFTVESYDRYSNGPTMSQEDLYIVYDPFSPKARISGATPITSRPIVLDAADSFDEGPRSLFEGIANYSWSISFWGETHHRFGALTNIHLTRPGDAEIELVVADAAGNSDTIASRIYVVDDISPSLDPLEDLNVLEDSSIEVRAKGISDNDPLISETGDFVWNISGPVARVLKGESVEFILDTPGRYEVKLTLTDTGGNTAVVPFNITVLDITTPNAAAGPDIRIVKGGSVSLSARNSSDNDPRFPSGANFTWILKGFDMILYGAEVVFFASSLGEFRMLLKVSDAAGNVNFDEVLIEVLTDGTAPEVLESYPKAGEQEIGPGSSFRMVFSEPLDGSTLDLGIHMLSSSGLEVRISRISSGPSEVIVTPGEPLEWGKEYRLRITPDLKDITGEPSKLIEYLFRVRPAYTILKINGLTPSSLSGSTLEVRKPQARISIEMSAAPSSGATLDLVGEQGASFTLGASEVENRTLLFDLGSIGPGTYDAVLNGTSNNDDPMTGERSFRVEVLDEEKEAPVTSDQKWLPWVWIIMAVGVILALLAVSVLIVRIRKKRSNSTVISGPTAGADHSKAHEGSPEHGMHHVHRAEAPHLAHEMRKMK